MKLRNGFGSHMHLYSPILFDSQDLNHNLSTQPSATAGDASPVTTIVPELRWSPMGNGATSSASWFRCGDTRITNGRERIGFLPQWSFATLVTAGSAAGTCRLNYRLGLTFDGNGQWRRISRTCCQGRWSCTMSTTQWSGGRLAMEPMEGATIPEKIYSKL